jgi:hypothetical protein
MIETCSYCGAVHEVGGEDSFHGVPIKSCPFIEDERTMYFLPRVKQGHHWDSRWDNIRDYDILEAEEIE